MSLVEFGLMLGLGLVSSLHCAQMCGPIVLSYSLATIQDTTHQSSWFPARVLGHLAYNAGRILTYSLLGAVAGLLGQSMTWMGRLAGVGSAALMVAGGLLIVGGMAMMGWLPALSILGESSIAFTARFLRPFKNLLSSPRPSRRFALGLALGFLPCGLVYAALIKSLASGSMVGGAFDMFAFGLGTASSLLAIGIFSTAIRGKLSRWSSPLAAASVVLMGAVLLWRASIARHYFHRSTCLSCQYCEDRRRFATGYHRG